jgi:cation diffusion facilitator CzcD-associated flavoprotein CzcO
MGERRNNVRMDDPDHFRVVIAGGGLAGLTLANSLEVRTLRILLLLVPS